MKDEKKKLSHGLARKKNGVPNLLVISRMKWMAK